MQKRKDTIIGAIEKVTQTAANVTEKVVKKTQKKADEIALRKRLEKVQQSLGNLVYISKKTGKENEEIIARYVKEIDVLKAELEIFSKKKYPQEPNVWVKESEDIENHSMFVAVTNQNFPQNKATIFMKK